MTGLFTKYLSVLILIAVLTACGGAPELAAVNPGGSGNGEGYPGGDETISAFAGRYYFQTSGYKCRAKANGKYIGPAVASHKYSLEVDNKGRVTVFGNGCQSRTIEAGRTLHGLGFAPYNPHFVAKGNQLFTREGYSTYQGEYTHVKGFCRRMQKNGDGLDVVILELTESKRLFALTYWQRRLEGELDVGSLEPIPVEHTQSGSLHTIKGHNINVTVDHSIRYNKNRYMHGTVSITDSKAQFEEPLLWCTYKNHYKD